MADSRIDCHDVGLQLWHFFNHGKPELMREMIPATPPPTDTKPVVVFLGFMWLNHAESWLSTEPTLRLFAKNSLEILEK